MLRLALSLVSAGWMSLAASLVCAQEVNRLVSERPMLAQSNVVTGRFVADLHGAPGVATVSYEPLRNYAVFAGEIRSQHATYTFTADIVGDSGFGEMLDHQTGARFQIQIQNLSPAGFVLISNPFQSPTAYLFRRY